MVSIASTVLSLSLYTTPLSSSVFTPLSIQRIILAHPSSTMSKYEAEHLETGAGEHPPLQEIPSAMDIDAKEAHGQVTQIQTASVALAAAVAAQKPRLLSRNMIQLYAIMAIGYLVSTMNGFGMYTLLFYSQYFYESKTVYQMPTHF